MTANDKAAKFEHEAHEEAVVAWRRGMERHFFNIRLTDHKAPTPQDTAWLDSGEALMRARPATAPVTRKPDGYAYAYPNSMGGPGRAIHFEGGGRRINGSEPIEAIPYFLGTPPATAPGDLVKEVRRKVEAGRAAYVDSASFGNAESADILIDGLLDLLDAASERGERVQKAEAVAPGDWVARARDLVAALEANDWDRTQEGPWELIRDLAKAEPVAVRVPELLGDGAAEQALWSAMNRAAQYANRDDDKVILAELRKVGIHLATTASEPTPEAKPSAGLLAAAEAARSFVWGSGCSIPEDANERKGLEWYMRQHRDARDKFDAAIAAEKAKGVDPMSAAAQVHNEAATIIGDLKQRLEKMTQALDAMALQSLSQRLRADEAQSYADGFEEDLMEVQQELIKAEASGDAKLRAYRDWLTCKTHYEPGHVREIDRLLAETDGGAS